ncbi:N-6 DNA methylase [Pseudoalteromonas piscicida]|uniref:N-6 DNA methylase n=1 Tax=Pseudoalteromonas piscicida TaxID=43662 RepID=UPI0030C9C2A8
MSSQKQLGQFFTPKLIADRLISCLSEPVGNALELGAGDGILGLSLLARFPKAAYIGIEKDPIHFSQCLRNLAPQSIICGDVMNDNLHQLIKCNLPVDTVIGNPPFIGVENFSESVEVIKSVFPLFKVERNNVRAELVFLAISMNFLKKGGQASFILPSSFITSNSYAFFRKYLVENCSDIGVFELPAKIFSKAEVSTSIVSFKNSPTKTQNVTLGTINTQGELVDQIQVSRSNAISRMDYSFHKIINDVTCSTGEGFETLESIGGCVLRGNHSRAKLEAHNVKYFHTTSFPKYEHSIVLDKAVDQRFNHATEGNILTARVGSRCLDRQVLVASGSRAITDCIFRIKVPDSRIDQVMKTLSSDYGKVWRKVNAQGSCARFITKSTILSMPLIV